MSMSVSMSVSAYLMRMLGVCKRDCKAMAAKIKRNIDIFIMFLLVSIYKIRATIY
jgi:hypothetical protein